MDTWSTVTFYIFLAELVLLGALIGGAFVATERAGSNRGTESGLTHTEDPPPELTLGDDVLIDISSRYNEAVVANIDAIDTALVAILALPVAFAVFAVDKIRDLGQTNESVAILFLLASCLSGFVGYAWGLFLRRGASGMQDGIEPRRFLADYIERGGTAVSEAIRAVNTAGDQNAAIRRVKRAFALGALMYFLIGAAAVAVPLLNKDFHVARKASNETAEIRSVVRNNRGADVVR